MLVAPILSVREMLALTDEKTEAPEALANDTAQRQAFLLRTAVLLHQHGTPSHRLEAVMNEFSRSIGCEGVFLYTPTSLIVSFGKGDQERTFLRRVDAGEVDAGKLVQFDETLEDLESGRTSLSFASMKMEEIAAAPPTYGRALTVLACGIASGAVAVFFGGNLIETCTAIMLSLCLAALEMIVAPLKWDRGLFPPLAGFLAANASILIAHFIEPMDDRLATLASLVIFMPGLKLTIALTELAVGHLSAGVARLAGAIASLLTLVVGVAIAWRMLGDLRQLPSEYAWALPSWAWYVALIAAPAAFAILFRARIAQWPVIFAVSLAGFLATLFGSRYLFEAGPFLGALTVGLGANLYARLANRPALAVITPGMVLLVPGSLGYRSLTYLIDRETIAGVDFAFNMLLVAMSVVGGFLAANAALPPKRNL
jgi:uncharacterized membrane protein YjjP (DUF1212 family)